MNVSEVKAAARRSAVALFLIASVAFSAFADGPSRKATEAEKAFHHRILTLFSSVLTGLAPEGWETTEQSEIEDIERLGEGTETLPLPVDYRIAWADTAARQKAEEEALARVVQAAPTLTVDEQLMAEYEQLAERIAEAAAAGDTATVAALQPKIEEKSAAIREVYEAADAKIVATRKDLAPKDTSAKVSLFANRMYQSVDPEAKKTQVNGFKAFRTPGYHNGAGEWNEGSTLVFIGDRWFAPPGEAAYQFANQEDVPNSRLQCLVVRVDADEARSDALLNKIDWQSLKSAIGH